MIDLHGGRQVFDFDCGVMALQIVMAYYGVEIRGDELMKALGTTGLAGTPIASMVSVAESKGFQVVSKTGWTMKELKQIIDLGYPVIVLVQAWANRRLTLEEWRNNYNDGHYVIVIGYAQRFLLFEDPASFHRTWLWDREFLSRWHDRDPKTGEILKHFGMVLMGKDPASKKIEHMG